MTGDTGPKTLTDYARRLASGILEPVARVLVNAGIHPDTITIVGLLIVLIACAFITQGQMTVAAVVLLLGLPLDAVDGAVARQMNRQGQFGAVLDSTLDRYADGFIFGSLSYYFAVQDQFEWMALALLALVGSFLVSYVRARGEGIDVSVKEGLFTRLERLAIIIIMLLISPLLPVGIIILAAGTNFTAMQRLWFVYRLLNDKDS